MWQANHVADALRQLGPDVETRLVSTATRADLTLDTPISALGGKGAFSKEIQFLVASGQADIAVHSAKDLQAVTPDGLLLAAFPRRGDPRDALVGSRLAELTSGSSVATGSNRRRALLTDLRPGLVFHELRGNIATRLAKASAFDAIVMAVAAIERLQLNLPVVDPLDPSVYIPQVGQGALAVEVRDPSIGTARDRSVAELVSALNHEPTAIVVNAERQFLAELGGDCTLPAGAHATLINGDELSIDGILADSEGNNLQRLTLTGSATSEPGRELARQLRKALEQATP